MISLGAAMLGAAGIGAAGSLIGGYLGGKGAGDASARQIAWERERAQNAHQWEVEDLKKAGLNPILSAGGTGAATGSIDAVNTKEGYANALNNIGNSAMTYAQMRLNLEQQKADIRNQTALTNAQVAQANANTARTMALTPQEISTMKHNRLSYVEKEILKPAWRTLLNGGAVGSAISTKRFRQQLTNDIKNGKATTFPFKPLKFNKPTK